jgi:hypothetical protein
MTNFLIGFVSFSKEQSQSVYDWEIKKALVGKKFV